VNYIFIREDLVDLKEHLMAIHDSCVDKMMGLQDSNSFVTEKVRKYWDFATKKAFQRYWEKCKRNCGWDKKLLSSYETNVQDEMEE
jgi:hypothetical protein